MARGGTGEGISRRTLLVGGGVGAGLVLAWALWPRSYAPNLRAAPGESVFNAFLRIGRDGRVIVAAPQAELGQGVYTSLPQILADELGADWRTIAVEPSPIHPLYANPLPAIDEARENFPDLLEGIGDWAAHNYAAREALMITGGSTSIRAFEPRLREAGAAARALLSKAAAKRWGVEWEALDTAGGFVIGEGERRLSFGELAEEAAALEVPATLPMRGGIENRLVGQSLARLDLPSKIDGSAQFGADIRMPDLVYASVRSGPIGGGRLIRADKKAADAVPGVFAVVEETHWVAAVATNWWAANKAVEAMKPAFETRHALATSASVDIALEEAMGGAATRIFEQGDIETAYGAGSVFRAHYAAGVAPGAPPETLTATARLTGDRLEVWAPTQAPGHARAAAARAAGMAEAQVTIHRTLIGGGYGRKLEQDAIAQAATLAVKLKRPVQLIWSRIEETVQDGFRPPAHAALSASMQPGGRISGWQARIAAPATHAQVIARLSGENGAEASAHAAAVEGAVPPYAIPSVAIDHLPADTGLRTGIWRSGAHSYTAFFTESFIDELARKAGVEPLSFRMQMLGDNPRLAVCLSTATALGGWDGGAAGSIMGIAAHSAFGSHIALLVEAEVGADQRIRVSRAVAAVDCGRVINPDIVKQLVEGAIVHGIAGATGNPVGFEGGVPDMTGFDRLVLPRLADSPEVTVEIVENDELPGGVTELGVPPVAPAIANAIFAATGQRLRSLPLTMGSGA